MTLPFLIDGAAAVIPGVYDTFRVQGSLPNAAPAGRSILIMGEAEDGIPGSLLDLRLNFFTNFNDVRNFYTSGPIVDAASMLFSNQPSAEFSGSLLRLYVWKTNNTSRASKAIVSPANYGSLVSAVYSESGNFIQSQITSKAAVLPTLTFNYLPSPASRSYKVNVNGTLSSTLVLSGGAYAPALVSDLNGVTGLNATGGTARATISGILTVNASLSAVNDVLTITKTGGTGDFGTATQPGDTMVIPEGTAFSGTANANCGSYNVESWSPTQIVIRQLKHEAAGAEANAATFDLAAVTGAVAADVLTFAPVVVTVTGAPVTGQAASLEILGLNGALFAAGNMIDYANENDNLTGSAAAIGTVSATVPASTQLQVTLANAAWMIRPQPGDVMRIPRGSQLAGAGNTNVGLYVVLSSSATSTLLESVYGLTTGAVASTNLAGNTSVAEYQPGFVSSTAAALKTDSSAEYQVTVNATRVTDGTTFPAAPIGGTTAMEISYNGAGATAATLTIDQNRVLTITPSGAGSTISVRLLKYKTLQNLVQFLNTQAGVYAQIPDVRNNSLPPTVLDEVQAMPILGSIVSEPAYNGRVKMDYYSWVTYFNNNTGFLSFAPGTMTFLAGLPAAEATPGFLQGAAVGATADSDVSAGLNKGLNVTVRMVIPLFSRDAQGDVADGLTDPGSTYDIASINTACQGHVATASNSINRQERFAMLSIHDTFDNSVQAAGTIGYERCQMTFQDVNATSGSDGTLQWMLPWMGACAIAAGRAQAPLGTSMLRKSFLLNGVRHLGGGTLFPADSNAEGDFNQDDLQLSGDVATAISGGLMTFRAISGSGVQVWSPDLSTRSKNNDPQGWVYERVNVLFTLDEVRQTIRSTLENFIGKRQTDTPLSVVKTAGNDVIGTFISGGSLVSGSILDVTRLGNGYKARTTLTPTEAVEAIVNDVVAVRAPVASA